MLDVDVNPSHDSILMFDSPDESCIVLECLIPARRNQQCLANPCDALKVRGLHGAKVSVESVVRVVVDKK